MCGVGQSRQENCSKRLFLSLEAFKACGVMILFGGLNVTMKELLSFGWVLGIRRGAAQIWQMGGSRQESASGHTQQQAI